MAESTESLNIIEDFGEFINEYESTTRNCFDNSKKVLANIVNKSNLVDLDKYIGTHLNKLQESIDFLSVKFSDDQNSVEDQDSMLRQTMQHRFGRDEVKTNAPKMSSSVGFRDVPPRHKNNSRLASRKVSPDHRSTSYSKWNTTKGTNMDIKNMSSLDDYYKTNNAINNCQNILKILFMNCDELTRKFSNTHKEYEIVQDLMTQNEEHFIDLVENTDRFLQDLQDSGFMGNEPQNDNLRMTYQTDGSNAQKYIRELDGITSDYAPKGHKKIFGAMTPYKTFSSAKSRDRGADVRSEFLNSREIALYEQINKLQNEIYHKDNTLVSKYESTVDNLEMQLKQQNSKLTQARNKYKLLAQLSTEFQAALKQLQKAVRSKKYNIASYKKIFDEKARLLNQELYDFKKFNKRNRNLSSGKQSREDNGSSKRTRTISPPSTDVKNIPNDTKESNLSPTNLNRVYYESENSRKNAEIEKLMNQTEKFQKQVENYKFKIKELTKEKEKLNQLFIEKERLINEKDKFILELQKNLKSKRDSNQEDSDGDDNGALQIYKHRLHNADAEINALKQEVKRLEGATNDANINNMDIQNSYRKKLQKEKTDVEELIDDTQGLIESKIRNLNSRLSEKEKLLNKVIVDVRERIEAAKMQTIENMSKSHNKQISDLKIAHKNEANSLKQKILELEAQENEVSDVGASQDKIDELMITVKRKTQELKDKNDEIIEINNEIQQKDDEIISLSDQILALKSKHLKEVKDLKANLSRVSQELETSNQLQTENDDLRTQVRNLETENSSKTLEHKLAIQQKDDQIKSMNSKLDEIKLLKQQLSSKDSIIQDKDEEMLGLNQKATQVQADHTKILKSKNDEFTKKLNKLREEYETEKDQLSDQFDKKYQELEIKCKDVTDRLKKMTNDKTNNEKKLLDQISDLKQQNSESISQLEAEHAYQISSAKAKLEQKVIDYDKLKKTLDLERSSANDQLNQTEKELKSKLDNANNEVLKLKSDLETTKSQCDEYKFEISQHKATLLSKDAIIKQQKQSIGELSSQITEKSSKIESLESSLDSLSSKVTSMSTEKDKNKAKIDELTQELQFKSTQETVVIKEKEEQVSSQMQTHKKVVDNMSIKIDDLKEELNSEKQARIEIEEELENYQIKTDDQDNEIKNLTQKIKHLTKASQEGNKELIGLKTELDKKKDIEKQVDKYKFEQIQLKQEIEDLRNDTSEGNEAAQKAMNQLNLKDKEIDKLKQLHSKEVQAKNDQIKQHESEIDNKNNHIVLLKQETDNTQIQLQKQISDNDQKINKLNEEVKKSTEKFNQSKTKLDDLTKKLKSVESENESLKDQISNLKSTISDKEKTIVQKLESISNLEDENKNYKNYIEEYEETNNSLSDALTSCKVENGELNYKIKRLEQQIEEYENQHRNDNDTSATTINNLKQRINDVNQENENLRNKVNDLKESEQRLKTEVGQYKLHVDRIKREKDEELIKIDQTKDELIEEANKQLENFDAEKHAFKAKIKSLLIEYCDLDEDSYQMGDDVDMDEYLETLEKELKVYTERVKEKSMDQVSKFIEDLESAQAQQNSLGNELTTFKKQNDELSEINTKLELTIKHLQDEMEKTEQSKQTAQKEKSKFEKLSADLEKNVKFYEQINEQLELNKTELETKIENFEKSKKQLEDQIEELESELDKKEEQVLL